VPPSLQSAAVIGASTVARMLTDHSSKRWAMEWAAGDPSALRVSAGNESAHRCTVPRKGSSYQPMGDTHQTLLQPSPFFMSALQHPHQHSAANMLTRTLSPTIDIRVSYQSQ
jgi:hypothetical protein